ncbi:MAG TPA: helix-turn-helix domain-containing protein [Gemmatimonadaceae bacterium]
MSKSAKKRPTPDGDRRSGCPISIALELFGDRWTLLIVRDLMFKGLKRFGEFAEAGEGIASNVLTDRLARLEAAGVITRAPDPDDARMFIYRLTSKGMDLAPVLVEIVLWSARHERTDAPPAQVRAMTQREAFLARMRRDWEQEEP